MGFIGLKLFDYNNEFEIILNELGIRKFVNWKRCKWFDNRIVF